MPNAAKRLFEDESLSGDEADVDEAIRRAGGDPRAAVRALLVEIAEVRRTFVETSSLGFRRGLQPPRRL